jgi:chorismate synthase
MSNTIGHLFRVTTFGESHGPAVGCLIDGCPPRIPIQAEDIQRELDRRRPGQPLTSPRRERDEVRIISGVFENLSLGTPILLLVANTDSNPKDYESLKEVYRPSHADYTVQMKYGIRDHRGGGRLSGRETVGRVAAGAVAARFLRQTCPVTVTAWISAIGDIRMPDPAGPVDADEVDASPVRCPDPRTGDQMVESLARIAETGDSIGGLINCSVSGVPAGWGEPVFDKLHAELGKAVLSIPGCKGFQIGSGFGAAAMRGSRHNDPFQVSGGRIRTSTNFSGGIQGGISNGEAILFQAAFKPTPSIRLAQQTVTKDGVPVRLEIQGRHDPCIAIRAVPVVEAMVWIMLADHCLRHRAGSA